MLFFYLPERGVWDSPFLSNMVHCIQMCEYSNAVCFVYPHQLTFLLFKIIDKMAYHADFEIIEHLVGENYYSNKIVELR